MTAWYVIVTVISGVIAAILTFLFSGTMFSILKAFLLGGIAGFLALALVAYVGDCTRSKRVKYQS